MISPRFIEPISDVYVHQGQEAHFRAMISGQPLPKVTWYCNYKKIMVCEHLSSLPLIEVLPFV